MGAVIYLDNPTIVSKNIIPDEIGLEIASIKDGWGTQAFRVDGNYIDFIASEMEGQSPFTDGVEAPLEKLFEIAKKHSLTLKGNLYITSSCSDYDDMAIHIKDNEMLIKNAQIEIASTEELIEELINRKVLPEGFKAQ